MLLEVSNDENDANDSVLMECVMGIEEEDVEVAVVEPPPLRGSGR